MTRDRFSALDFIWRLIAALILVYATYNPEGFSYVDWVAGRAVGPSAPVWLQGAAVKVFVGFVLLTAWVIFLNATRHSLGFLGVTLILAICGSLIWLLAEWDVFNPNNSVVIVHLFLLVVATILAVGLSWSHIQRRLTGQVDTDEIE